MTMRRFGVLVVAGIAIAASFAVTSPVRAQPIACGYPVVVPVHLAGPCVYQGDRIAHQGPTYSGPAVIAPQPTYSPSPSIGLPVFRRTAVYPSK